MKIIILLLALLTPLFSSCANMGRVSTVIDPKEVHKEDFKSLPSVTTPLYKFRLTTVKSLSQKRVDLATEVDCQFREFSRCMGIKDEGEEARRYLISVVDGTFECRYQWGRCNGEYDTKNQVIIVNYKAFNREGILPLLKHEWAHVYGILESYHSNLDEVAVCTKY